jgi:hypothetical protein
MEEYALEASFFVYAATAETEFSVERCNKTQSLDLQVLLTPVQRIRCFQSAPGRSIEQTASGLSY